MEQISKIKVAMITHASSAKIRSHLPLDDRRLYAMARKVLGMSKKPRGYGDIAPWNIDTINYMRKREDIDFYVISAHSGLKKKIVSYEEEGVKYFFIRCDIATLLKRLIPIDKIWRRLNPMVTDVHHLIDKINPDIVLLMGLENAHYSGTVLGINKYPVYCLCQTIYNNPNRYVYSTVDSKNATTEMEIFKEHKYFGVYCKMHYELLRGIAPNAFIFKFGFPSEGKLLEPVNCAKKYDFVNYAVLMSEKKGFTDAIEATAIVKVQYPNVKLNLVGGGSAENRASLISMVAKLGLQDNVVFTDFFEKQSDMFLHIQQSRFAVLPCKLDNVSGTMMQAMQLGLPIVVYKTTGTPAFNKEEECALIADHSNVEDLAAKMLILLNHPEKAEQLKINARKYQERISESVQKNGDKLIDNIKAIIDNYKDHVIIPQEQLFNPEKDD